MRWSDVRATRKSTHPDVAPIQKLFQTVELCEGVLEYLSMTELFRAGQVCRRLQIIIQKSSVLQAKLFLAPELGTKTIAVSSRQTLIAGAKAEEHIAAAEAHKTVKESGEIKLFVLHSALYLEYGSHDIYDGIVHIADSSLSSYGWSLPGEAQFHHASLEKTSSDSSLSKMYITATILEATRPLRMTLHHIAVVQTIISLHV